MNLLFLNIGTQELILILMLIFMCFIPTILIIISLIDILKRQFTDSGDKILMIVLVFFLPVIGSCVYLFSLRHKYPLIKDQIPVK
ncbi:MULTISPECIES: PLDc N-terminal domain-containing protein [unclassified Sphingobacterium]|nr:MULTISPECIES: PLDc N-terminal domain-containing protein [unclassified Sphingobacterium]